jgi:hypothetical protein
MDIFKECCVWNTGLSRQQQFNKETGSAQQDDKTELNCISVSLSRTWIIIKCVQTIEMIPELQLGPCWEVLSLKR